MCREGEVMEDNSTLNTKREEQIKEQMIDDAFKHAEVERGILPPEKKPKKRTYEKTFPKLGILLIILAILGLLLISNVPWAYLKYAVGDGNIETSINLFQSPHYIGLSEADFSEAPATASSGFIALIILGIIITIFGILDKILKFSVRTFIVIHFIFGAVLIVPGTVIALSSMKFLGSHFLLHYNAQLISNPEVTLLFPAVFVVIVLGFIIAKLAFTIMRMDFKELQKMKEFEAPKQSLLRAYGSGSQ
jgi:hypothetical protein